MSIIDEKYIYMDLDVSSKEDIFEKLGTKLINDGVVKSTFIEALIERENDYPTGLPLPIGVAIPHTDATHVNEDQLVIATLSNPVKFVEMGTEEDEIDVELVIMIVMSDGKNHLEILQNIISTVQNEEIVKQVIGQKEPTEVRKILEDKILAKKGELL